MIHTQKKPSRDVRREELARPAKRFTREAYDRIEECPADREPAARELRIQAIIRRVNAELRQRGRRGRKPLRSRQRSEAVVSEQTARASPCIESDLEH